MSGNGAITQCLTIFLRERITLAEIERQLAPLQVIGRYDYGDQLGLDSPAVLMPYRPDVHGRIVVDLVDHPWDDGLSDAQEEFARVGSPWSSGAHGPWAYPGCLGRAREFCWDWDEAEEQLHLHRGYLRIRSTYSLGQGADHVVWPVDYDAREELLYLSGVAELLLDLPQALCYFNPGGEVLQTRDVFATAMTEFRATNRVPYFLWSNMRVYPLDELPQWRFADSIGNEQLGLPDLEALYLGEGYDDGEVTEFLYEMTDYLVEEGDSIEDGTTVDGDGVPWMAERYAEGAGLPPRAVVRFTPLDGSEPPELTGRRFDDTDDEDKLDESVDERSDNAQRGRFRKSADEEV